MKLNPPASSSDLELAREIARRLHQTRRRADLPRPQAVALAPPPPAGTKPSPPAPVEPSGAPAPAPFPDPPPLPPAIEIEEDQPPSWDVQVETSEAEDAGDANALSADEILGDHDGSPLDDVADGPVAEAPAEPPPFDIEEDPEPLPPPAPDEAPLDASPFDEVDVDAPEPAPTEAGPEDLLDAAPSPPSWDEIIHSCLVQSQARGAMLVDPAGQVFAVEGEWPRPGAEAIAAKLVAMLDRTLRDAPTRSVSAPLAGLHLTAWRVSLAEGLVTIAFIAEAPLRAELRPAIDAEIGRGGGA